MAIFGTYTIVRAQTSASPLLQKALDYAEQILKKNSHEQARLKAMAAGDSAKVELADGLFAIDAAYLSKVRSEGFFESHRKYIDVQVIVEGEELMEVQDIAQLVVTEAYNPERDFIKYADTSTASVLKLRAGDVAVFYPADGHMPSLQGRGAALVRKTVVKVPVG